MSDVKTYQATDFRKDPDALQHLIELYFHHEGQIKYVAADLGIRRNTIIHIISRQMIPKIVETWLYQCQGSVESLATQFEVPCCESFLKTLRWHQRFEKYVSALQVETHHMEPRRKILKALKDQPEDEVFQPQQPLTPQQSTRPVSQECDDEHFCADTVESISEKITRLKTLRFGTMMVLGETGAGKGWLAKQIYRYLYPDGKAPYIHINCAHLIEAAVELFGSVKGAFTDAVERPGAFELIKDGGVLFLDEIDALPIDVQMKLLLVLGEEGMFYRVGSNTPIYLERYTLITATNQDLEQMVLRQQFRNDLLGRINSPYIRLRNWQQQPLEVKMNIIRELQDHIIENDFEEAFQDDLQEKFTLSQTDLDILLHSQYSYNIRSVRKQLTAFMTRFLLDSNAHRIEQFRF